MRIGIDIDGVLTNIEQFSIDYFSKYCIDNNIDYSIGERDYKLEKSFGVETKIKDDFWKEYLYFYSEKIMARPFASEIISKLKDAGHEIYIITARWLANRDDEVGEQMRETVKNWLSQNKIEYDELIFSKASNEKKSQEIIENRIDLMIEDNPNNISELSKIIPIICYDSGYNQDCIGKNILRCFSWYDVYKKINEMNKKDIEA